MAAASVTPFSKARAAWKDQQKYVDVGDGLNMAYVEMGDPDGDPILFLHGNLTSSYLWRNIMPYCTPFGRCIAPDFMGMGYSDRLPNSGPGVYTYENQRKYMFRAFEALGIAENIVPVIHDWGSILGFDLVYSQPESIKGVAFMESVIRPPRDESPPAEGPPRRGGGGSPPGAGGPPGRGGGGPPGGGGGRGFFSALKGPEGEKMILQDNVFVERIPIDGMYPYLSDEDIAEYRRPYLEPGESRRPTLTWPRELPVGPMLDGNAGKNAKLMEDYSVFLKTSDIPKLFIKANPGLIMTNPATIDYIRTFPNLTEAEVYGPHYIQEASPDAIGRNLADWLVTLS